MAKVTSPAAFQLSRLDAHLWAYADYLGLAGIGSAFFSMIAGRGRDEGA